MIKVGDYLRFKRIIHGFVNESIDRVEDIVPTPNNKYMIYFENLEHGILFDDLYDSRIVDYKSLYEQQKQRADELEKQNDILKHNIRVELDSSRDMYIGMCEQKLRADRAEKRWSELRKRMEHDEKEAFGEGDVIAHTVHNYVLELMHDLEEDGE